MKKTYILAAACLMAFAGCDNKEEINVLNDGVRMTLATDCAELITRATELGVEALNENLINDIHYYFFDKTTDAYISDGTQKIGSKNGTADFYLEGMNATKFNSIFSGGRTAVKVFVVANATTPSGSTTLAAIKSTALTLTGHGKQSSFVMTGEGTLTKNGTQSAATDEIKLTRVASKITLHLIIPNSYKDLANKEWIPQLGEVQIDFKNIEEDGHVGATIPTGTLDYVDVTRKATSTPSDFKLIPDESTTYMSLDVPVYSYPRNWANGDAATPYIYVTLPWKIKDSTGDYPETYYKILLPGNSLDPNCWYDITAKLGGLGSLTKEGTVDVDLVIKVNKEWKDAIPDGNDTDADVAFPRVLAVEQNTYILYNQNSIDIPFISSHDCELIAYDPTSAEVNSGKFPANHTDSGAGNLVSVVDDNVTPKPDNDAIYVDNQNRVIKFIHNLHNMEATGTTYDYMEFVQTYKLVHKTDNKVFEYITIRQRPALCVSREATATNTIFIDGGTMGSNKNTYRVLINSGSATDDYYIQRITASVLPTSGLLANYVLADPRIHTNQQDYYSGYKKQGTSNSINYQRSTAKHINGTTSYQLTYSYPTDKNSTNTIAPEFILCSRYPGVSGYYMGLDEANVRCATYQEAGYPAGRWRLPTPAEMTFVAKLQGDGKCGYIFNDGYDYIASDGYVYHISSTSANKITKNTTGSHTTKGSVRCVYDSWYWDNTTHPKLEGTAQQAFTWGDEPITW